MTGRLWLQLAFVALADAEAAYDGDESVDASAGEHARQRALSQRFAYKAAECGVVGGVDAAFGGDE